MLPTFETDFSTEMFDVTYECQINILLEDDSVTDESVFVEHKN